MSWNETWPRKLGRLAEPQVLFPLIAVALLAVVWSATFSLVRNKRLDTERAAAESTHALLGTYEAQVVRALREIRQALNLVKHSHEHAPSKQLLAELATEQLLPPQLVFTVSIADRDGNIVDSTEQGTHPNIADQDYFREQRSGVDLFIGRPPAGPTDDAQLQFSRRLDTQDGSFDGVVVVAVDAAYFVSGYEAKQLGERGVLALLGSDGIFRVRRTGNALYSGDKVDYAALVPAVDDEATAGKRSVNSWDGV